MCEPLEKRLIDMMLADKEVRRFSNQIAEKLKQACRMCDSMYACRTNLEVVFSISLEVAKSGCVHPFPKTESIIIEAANNTEVTEYLTRHNILEAILKDNRLRYAKNSFANCLASYFHQLDFDIGTVLQVKATFTGDGLNMSLSYTSNIKTPSL